MKTKKIGSVVFCALALGCAGADFDDSESARIASDGKADVTSNPAAGTDTEWSPEHYRLTVADEGEQFTAIGKPGTWERYRTQTADVHVAPPGAFGMAGWQLAVPQTALYEVEVLLSPLADGWPRSEAARYFVYRTKDDPEPADVKVDQRRDGWVSLGWFLLTPSASVNLFVGFGEEGYTQADSVAVTAPLPPGIVSARVVDLATSSSVARGSLDDAVDGDPSTRVTLVNGLGDDWIRLGLAERVDLARVRVVSGEGCPLGEYDLLTSSEDEPGDPLVGDPLWRLAAGESAGDGDDSFVLLSPHRARHVALLFRSMDCGLVAGRHDLAEIEIWAAAGE